MKIRHLAENYDITLLLQYKDAKKKKNKFLCALLLEEMIRIKL